MKEGGVVDFPTINTPGTTEDGRGRGGGNADFNLPSAPLSLGSACGWRGP